MYKRQSVINGTVDNLDGQMFAGSSAGLNVKAIIGVAALSPFYFIGFDVIPPVSYTHLKNYIVMT